MKKDAELKQYVGRQMSELTDLIAELAKHQKRNLKLSVENPDKEHMLHTTSIRKVHHIR